jgi:Uma2 family endonuclease
MQRVPYTAAMPHPGLVESASGPYTWDDFIRLDEDDLRELIDGQLVEVEVPKLPHGHAVATLVSILYAWAGQRSAGRVLPSGYKISISKKRGVMPDVQFYRADNPAPAGQDDGLEQGRPDLVIEVVSPTSRRYDRVTKLAWYAALGVPEYWIVDPEERTLERLTLAAEHYVIADALEGDALFRPPSFEGLELPLRKLWSV